MTPQATRQEDQGKSPYSYSETRRRQDKAASYDTKYERELHKRLSDRREKRLLGSLLARVGHQERLLDVPCGAGRLSPILARHARLVFEVDYSRAMIELCRQNANGYTPLVAEADVFHLPFADAAFDLVVSIRLSHHIRDHQKRLGHLRELFRLSRRFVLATFFVEESWKNRLRNLGRRLGSGKRAKYALRRDEVAALARECGFRILAARQLSRVFSGHQFTLFERT
jgi:SAM-dependent methyltransferase